MIEFAVAHAPSVESTEWLVLLPPVSRFILRGDPSAQQTAAATFGIELSSSACRASIGPGRAMLWLGPDEYLLIAPDTEATALQSALEASLRHRAYSLVDVSHRQVTLKVYGPSADWILNGGCPLDLDLAAFPPNMCTRTVFAKAEIVLWRIAPDAFHIEVMRSFTPYVVNALTEIARDRPEAGMELWSSADDVHGSKDPFMIGAARASPSNQV